MNRESTTLVEDVKQDAAEKIDASALRSPARTIPQPSAVNASAPKLTLGARIKSILMNVASALEGDHGTQNYRH
jgi:hypothetical protein